MSAAWSCEFCGGGDGEYEGHRVCNCVTVKQEDWLLLRSLWATVRAMRPGDPAPMVTADVRACLDALFFAGEECPAPPAPPTTAGGEDSCR